MTDEPEALVQRIRSMDDEELLSVLEHRHLYTEEALRLAEGEANRRGGATQLREKLAPRTRENNARISPNGGMTRRLHRLWSWLLPGRERFASYPELRIVVAGLRILALLAVLAPAAGIMVMLLAAIWSDVHVVAATTALGVLNALWWLIAALSVQAVIVVLVDIERNTRATRDLGGEMTGRKAEDWGGSRDRSP